jgi:hypothetical protein
VELFGRFVILGTLGEGGMGVVYEAHDPQLRRTVALKVVKQGGNSERFRGELEAVGRLRHPHLVQVHEAGEHEGSPYLVMELVEGESLSERLRDEGPLDPQEAARIAVALAEALGHAHEAGILHRDVKPGNVLIGDDGAPFLTDFGLAMDLEHMRERLTLTGQLVGSPLYMSPAQTLGSRALDPRDDLFSLGGVLFTMLTGRPPFEADSLVGLLLAISSQPPKRPRSLRPEVPRGLEAICLKALEKEPDDRHPSASAMADDLRRFLRREAPLAGASRGKLFGSLAALALAAGFVLATAWALLGSAQPPEATVAPAEVLRRLSAGDLEEALSGLSALGATTPEEEATLARALRGARGLDPARLSPRGRELLAGALSADLGSALVGAASSPSARASVAALGEEAERLGVDLGPEKVRLLDAAAPAWAQRLRSSPPGSLKPLLELREVCRARPRV